MKCSECGSFSTEFDERLGYTVCSDCGLVLNCDIFEERVSPTSGKDKGQQQNWNHSKDNNRTLGSFIGGREDQTNHTRKHRLSLLNRRVTSDKRYHSTTDSQGHRMCVMFMSPYKSGDAIDTDHVVYLYQRLMQHRILRGHSIEDRSAGLAYFILNDNGNVSLKDFVKTSGVEMKRVVRTAKKIAKFYRKSHIFAERDIPNMVTGFLDWFEINSERVHDRRDFFNFVEFIQNKYNERDLRFADSQLATTLWIAGKLTGTPIRQIDVKQYFSVSEVTLRTHTDIISEMLGIERKNIHLYGLDEIMQNVIVMRNIQ